MQKICQWHLYRQLVLDEAFWQSLRLQQMFEPSAFETEIFDLVGLLGTLKHLLYQHLI